MIFLLCLLLVSMALAVSPEEQEHKNDFIAFDLNQDGFVDASEVRI